MQWNRNDGVECTSIAVVIMLSSGAADGFGRACWASHPWTVLTLRFHAKDVVRTFLASSNCACRLWQRDFVISCPAFALLNSAVLESSAAFNSATSSFSLAHSTVAFRCASSASRARCLYFGDALPSAFCRIQRSCLHHGYLKKKNTHISFKMGSQFL